MSCWIDFRRSLLSASSQHLFSFPLFVSYPYAYMAFGSPMAYGSYKSLNISSGTCLGGASSGDELTYVTVYGEAYILLTAQGPDPASAATLYVESSCIVTECHGSQYMGSSGTCVNCPAGMVSNVSSTSITDCVACASIGGVSFPKSAECQPGTLVDTTIHSAQGWRLWAASTDTEAGWIWQVYSIEFYSDVSCSADSKVDTSAGTAIDAADFGNGWYPKYAFGAGPCCFQWGGKPNANGELWIGMEFPSNVEVNCIVIDQYTGRGATTVRVQALRNSTDWETVWVAENMQDGINYLANNGNGTVFSPAIYPTKAPTPQCGKKGDQCLVDSDCCRAGTKQKCTHGKCSKCSKTKKKCKSNKSCCSGSCTSGKCQ